ncbi:DUF4150 domain-containing protein [Xenorhabdus doucetiae]|uniref:Uncharacterized protein DUF4150 n=1 Tax=Xenorhabdus doucetiae TaxID=351671 RepID=A0A068QSG8_9GAMM|nr:MULTISPECIES: DUF4150 domain-containing protein [Xenorhabdus]MBD2786024.1 DUF4150 domain-containing protein [Xenorhabdus sp. 3]MBD2787224.1 DUF4150 domain-containing protein [Xenorhabdus sp. DI]MBD2797990.1 DUF4150 domain-containing protein [Xenorhabdus sp. 18]TYP12359.1 uncharacterized protein DUF4150 [Xenorhabdus doucetiae]CDG17596.1 conserved hypothetical protein [Xenorhabdus doucetiae]
MFANTQGGGMDLAIPDICLTPSPPGAPIPVPYPNTAQGTSGISASTANILFVGSPAHNITTIIAITNGDNPGVNLGVTSGTVMGPSRHTLGANSVLIKGSPATRLTSPTMQNSTNAIGSRISPSQTKVDISGA